MADVTARAERALIIRIRVEEGREGLLYATSPDLLGLMVAAEDRDALLDEVPKVIQALLQQEGGQVLVIEAHRPADSETLEPPPWVAIPAHVAAKASAGA